MAVLNNDYQARSCVYLQNNEETQGISKELHVSGKEKRLQCTGVPSRVGVAELVHDDTTEVHELKELVTSVHQTLVHHLHNVCVCVRERERDRESSCMYM